MITLYAAYNFPPFLKGLVRDLRARWALAELDLPYAIHWLDTSQSEHKGEANRTVNPFGKMPAMTDGAMTLFESAAIVHYLFEKAGRAPKDADARAHELQWSFAALNTIEPILFEIFMWDNFWTERPGRETRRSEVVGFAQTRLAELERALGAKPYLTGDALAPCDILMASVLRFALGEPQAFETAPGIVAYRERCYARPCFRSVLARHGEREETLAA